MSNGITLSGRFRSLWIRIIFKKRKVIRFQPQLWLSFSEFEPQNMLMVIFCAITEFSIVRMNKT